MKSVLVNGKRVKAEEFAGTMDQLKEELENKRNYTDEGEGCYQTQSIKAKLNIVDWNQESAVVEANIIETFIDDGEEDDIEEVKYFTIDQMFIEPKTKMTNEEIIKKYQKHFSMRNICETCGINYSTFTGWNNRGLAFSEKKKQIIVDCMLSILEEMKKDLQKDE